MQFLPNSGRIDTAVWMHYLDANKTAGEEARRQLHKNTASNIEQVPEATPHKAPAIRPPTSVKQGGIKDHFKHLWYDATLDWTPVSWNIGEHSTHWANSPMVRESGVQSKVRSYQRL